MDIALLAIFDLVPSDCTTIMVAGRKLEVGFTPRHLWLHLKFILTALIICDP